MPPACLLLCSMLLSVIGAGLSRLSRCYYTHLPSLAGRLEGLAFLRSWITVSDPLFAAAVRCGAV